MTATTATTIPAIEAARPAAPKPEILLRPVAGERERCAWADYVLRTPEGTLFHHPDWCDAVASVFGHTQRHCLAWRGERMVGVLPLMELRSRLAGRLLVSVPYATCGGILADDEAAKHALAADALHLADRLGVRMLELRSRRADIPALTADERYVRFIRRLPLRCEQLTDFLPRKARAAARQARAREGLRVQHDPALLPLVWRLYARSMRRLGSLNYPYRFFEALTRRLGPRAWVSLVWRGSTPVAGSLSLVFKDVVHPYFAGVDERRRSTGATNLLYLAIMERAVRAGLHWFDFGRSRRNNAGAFNFKRHQGFQPQPLGYQRYAPSGRTLPDLSPENPRFALARRVWPRLPLALTRPLGAWLSRSIPG